MTQVLNHNKRKNKEKKLIDPYNGNEWVVDFSIN